MQKLLIPALVASTLFAAGCSSQMAEPESVSIMGKTHYYDSDGYLVMSQSDYDRYTSTGIAKPAPSAPAGQAQKLTAEEFAVLVKDRTAFYSEIEGESPVPSEVSVLVREGSLKSNLVRIAGKLGYDSLEWGVDEDFHIHEPFSVTGIHRRAVIINVIADYPIGVFADEENNRLVFSPLSIPGL